MTSAHGDRGVTRSPGYPACGGPAETATQTHITGRQAHVTGDNEAGYLEVLRAELSLRGLRSEVITSGCKPRLRIHVPGAYAGSPTPRLKTTWWLRPGRMAAGHSGGLGWKKFGLPAIRHMPQRSSSPRLASTFPATISTVRSPQMAAG